MTGLAPCSVNGCGKPVQKIGHTLCYEHWKANRQTIAEPAVQGYVVSAAPDGGSGKLNATALGAKFELDAKQMNSVRSKMDGERR